MNIDNPVAQFFGVLSFIIAIICYLQKNDLYFKYAMLTLNVVHTLHYFLLDAIASALCTAIAIVRTYTSIKTSSVYVAYFFIALVVFINAVWGIEQWFDWLSVLGSCLGTYAMFCLTGIKMRLGFLLGSFCWLINNIMVFSIGGIALETLAIIVNLKTIYGLYNPPSITREITI
ncbi:YgjV family protein [Algibacillus agarilyticus]|uniref:YgjV family protein n=1 Tax=Algibacillus agarilyticus TaxID=2234133 RepID=UPI000DD0639F|nr:YgjV family protein [Algibacillus agarilyticus]